MKQLLFWIAISKLLVILIVLFSGIGLMPDEAQYWTWSKELSYGYYSKPPGIAWQIAFGTWLFGDNEFGVRFASILLSFGLSLALYWLAKSASLSHKQAFWVSIAFSFAPLGILSAFFATTDCAYVLFWTLACFLFCQNPTGNFLRLGVVIAIGALWKWPVYCIWLPIACLSWHLPKRLLGGMLVSLLGLVPSFIWNLSRGFPTFQHVASSIDLVCNSANPVEFLGAQVALVSPIFFFLIVSAFIRFKESILALRFCYGTALTFFLVIFGASFFEKVQGNWAVAAYPTAFVVMMRYARPLWVKIGTAVAVAMLAAVLFIPKIFIQGLGWNKMKPLLERSGYDVQKDFLFSDRYQATSLLSFYGPEQKRAFFFNIHNLRHNQYDFWPGMPDLCLGKTGYFVEVVKESEASNAGTRFKEKLKDYFATVTILPSQQVFKDRVAIILRCEGYNGKPVPSTNKY